MQVPGIRTWAYLFGVPYSMHSRMNGADRALWVCHMALGFPLRASLFRELDKGWDGHSPRNRRCL